VFDCHQSEFQAAPVFYDYQAGKLVTTVPIGAGVGDQYHVIENVPTPVGSRNIRPRSNESPIYSSFPPSLGK